MLKTSVGWGPIWTFKPMNLKCKYFLIVFFIFPQDLVSCHEHKDGELLRDRTTLKEKRMQKSPEIFSPFPLKMSKRIFSFNLWRRRKYLFSWILLRHQSIVQPDEKAVNQRVHDTYADNPLSRVRGGKGKVVETRLRIVPPQPRPPLLQPPAPPTAAQMCLRTRWRMWLLGESSPPRFITSNWRYNWKLRCLFNSSGSWVDWKPHSLYTVSWPACIFPLIVLQDRKVSHILDLTVLLLSCLFILQI